MLIKKYSPIDFEIWNDFINKSRNGIFMFDRNYMDYHSDRFEDHSLMFFDDDVLVALLPASIKNNILYSHMGLTYGGFLISEKVKQHTMLDCFSELKNYLKNKSIKKLIYKSIPHIFHSYPSEEDLYALYMNDAHLLKIEPSSALALDNPLKMPKGRKAQISKAKREGVIVEESMDFDSFIELENAVLKEFHNTSAVHTGKELSLLKSRFNENIKLYVAKLNDQIIAGTVIYIYKNTVHTQYMAASSLGRELGALDLVISTLMTTYKSRHKYLDFCISSENAGKILNFGLISQKEGFGARTVIYQTWELCTD